MFKNNKKLSPNITDTLIGAGTEMDGHLKSQTGVRIEGTYKGEIDSKGDIVIGEGGVVRSNIIARDVTIAGKVYGDVHTRGKLTITAAGQLHGNAFAAILIVQEGGILNGSSTMERLEEKKGGSSLNSSGSGLGSGGSGSDSDSGSSSDKKGKQAG
ncbi:polymer-forming cytoskeletal protein [Cohnella sp.]|uniref:bactofilin family protein n=1 Tax=Cohnella sp. TaxID=1883426 RepID=UPI0035677601